MRLNEAYLESNLIKRANQGACVVTDLLHICLRGRRKVNAENCFHKTAMADYDMLFKSITNEYLSYYSLWLFV